jgi:protoheme IX farnesyltransferase
MQGGMENALNHHNSPLTTTSGPVFGRTRPGWRTKLADYWALTKPEVNFLVLITTLVGFHLGQNGALRWALLGHALLGTLLVASGTATLNEFMEREWDAQMRRTAHRPLPAARLTPAAAFWFGIILSVLGGLYLALAVNGLASSLALLTLTSYLLIYTPLKRRTSYCTLIGAFPGAAPPLIGWAAVRGSLSVEAWILYAMVFLWQFPHFLAIAWMYRQDYARAGFRMLPEGDDDGRLTARRIIFYSLALLPVSLLPTLAGMTGVAYALGALLLGLAFLGSSARLAHCMANNFARRVLLVSVIYLPLVLGLMVLDKV